MPALTFLGRKWLIACDDFVVPCGIEASLRIIWCIITSVLTQMKINNCATSLLVDYSLYASAGYLVLTACLSCSIALISARGSVLEVGKRRLLSKLLFIRLVLVLCDVAAASFGVWLFRKMDRTCITKEVFIKITTILAWIYVIILAIGIMVCYDTLGSTKFWKIEASVNSLNFFKKAQYIWKMRLKLFCCCADISEEDDFVYVEISTFLASFLNGIDLVPTDILAGIITLSQKHVLERKKYTLVNLHDSIQLLDQTPVPHWMTPENALYFLKIAKSTYGWLAFFKTFHPWKLCILSPQARCCMNCCGQTDERTIDNCCYLNLAAVQKISGFTVSDIIYSSFQNNIHEPAFYVAIDHTRKYVIIAVRGTRSFSDLMTDIDAENLPFPIENACKFFSSENVFIPSKNDNESICQENNHKCIPSEGKAQFKCHRGALRSALFLQKKLQELNILEKAFADNPTYTLALTGHSLGGSIAAVLTLILRPRYPDLQCYAYGPLAVLSALGIPKTLGSVLTVVVAEDMAPRLCASSCRELRKQILESLDESKIPKYQILTGACWYHVQKYFQSQPHRILGEVHENKLCEQDEENALQPGVSVTSEDSKLYAPGRILYFERKNWYKPYWLTGLNLQSIIINPDMISDHQPHKIQEVLQIYMKSIDDSLTVVE